LDNVSQLPEVGAVVDNALDAGHGGSKGTCGQVVFRGRTEKLGIVIAAGASVYLSGDETRTGAGMGVFRKVARFVERLRRCGRKAGALQLACMPSKVAATSQISATSPFQSQLKSSSSTPHCETRLIVTFEHVHSPISQWKYTKTACR
jgi:hypothetical protein